MDAHSEHCGINLSWIYPEHGFFAVVNYVCRRYSYNEAELLASYIFFVFVLAVHCDPNEKHRAMRCAVIGFS